MIEWLAWVIIGQSHAPATKATGVLAYALAAALCGWALRGSRTRERMFWGTLAAVELLLLADVRWDCGTFLADHARAWAGPWYQEKGAFLPLVLLGFGAFWLVSLLGVCWLARRWKRPLLLALVGASSSVLVHGVQAVSWHQTDAVLYQLVGPVMLVAWMWLAAAAATGMGAVASQWAIACGGQEPTPSA